MDSFAETTPRPPGAGCKAHARGSVKSNEGRGVVLSSQRSDPPDRFPCPLVIAESGEPEKIPAVAAETGSGGSHHPGVFQQIIEILPGFPAAGTFQPDIGGILPAGEPDACLLYTSDAADD